ncbi:hypothetical protein IWQ56_002602 [Coemansia nantahalensis]|nr:hypothetical protein IWQ56_002602 [Coemansia nantahalensis]
MPAPEADGAEQPKPRAAAAAAQMRDVGRQREQRVGDYIVKQTLGKGTFSKVYLGEYRPTKQKVALKFIKPKSPQGGSTDKHNLRVEREIRLLSLLFHPNIVRLYDVIQTPKFTMIVMEHNSGGELLHHIRKRGRLHESEARGLFRQIVSAVDYMHQNCVIHRDLKMENVMMDRDNRVRLIDFGFANTFEWDKQLDTFCGSPFYAAPEMVNGIKYTGPEVDIWSMGVILFFMLCGRTPFEGECLKEIYDKISRGRFEVPQQRSWEAQDLLRRILTVDPRSRISMKGIIDHPWLNKDFDQPVNNHLPQRATVVLHPNELALQKMPVYKYAIPDVTAALANSDMAKTPMVCIYHLVEESRRRKASRNARRSHATNLGGDTPDASRPASRGRHADADSPVAASAGAAGAHPSPAAARPDHRSHAHKQALQPPQPPYLAPHNSDLGSSIDAPSFGAGQYEPPRPRKGSSASGQLSVSSSLNLDVSSPFLRDDDRRASRSSRFFDRVRKSMPFLKTRRSQVIDAPPMEQSHAGPRNRASFFHAPFRRLSAAPSAASMANVQPPRVPSYAHPVPPPPPPPPLQQQPPPQQPRQLQQQSPPAQAARYAAAAAAGRPRTANGDTQPAISLGDARPATSGDHRNRSRHRHTDFGPQLIRKPEPPTDLPADAPRRAARPLSVSSSRQLTPLRLHPTQNQQQQPQLQPQAFLPTRGAAAQLPPALTTRGSAPVVGSPAGQQAHKGNVLGMFNLKCTLLGPLDEIGAKIERVLKAKSIVRCKITDVVYTCEDNGIRFEIIIDAVQGHLHTIKFKRLEGNWWAYKRLTSTLSTDLQAVEHTAR